MLATLGLDDDPSYLAFGNPFAHPLHFAGLELVFALCFGLTIRDVTARYRNGDRYALFQWLVVLAYGVAMELIAFNAYPDYAHGQFTVQLYHHKLPLYITLVYVVFHYTGLKLAARARAASFAWIAEAITCGLVIALMDVPFDLAGVDARWWTWSPSGRDVTQRWLGVPWTSYEWYLIFGAVMAAVCRGVKGKVEGRSVAAYVALAPLVAVGIIVLGIVGFLPFHALEAAGVPDGAIVGAHAGVAGAIAIAAARQKIGSGHEGWAPVGAGLRMIPVLLGGWHVGVIVVLWRMGLAAGGGEKAAVAAVATGGGIWLFGRLQGSAESPGSARGAEGTAERVAVGR